MKRAKGINAAAWFYGQSFNGRIAGRSEDVIRTADDVNLLELQSAWEQGFDLAFEGEPWLQFRDRRIQELTEPD